MSLKNELTPAEKWNSLTLANNFIFCKVLEENPDVSKKILEMLLNIKIDRIEKTCSEYSLKTDFDSHGVRFDVYVKDGTGRCFDIEIQTSKVTKLAKRARYYQGLMDVDNIQSGGNYESLKESYVIFLCMGDAFGYNLPVYTFRYIALEDKAIEMGDGTVNVFFNAGMYDKMESEKLRSFFKYLCGKTSKDNFTDRLSALVERVKMNAQWRHRYMTWEQEMRIQAEEMAKNMAENIAKDMASGMANGIAKNLVKEEVEEKTRETARKLLSKNIPEDVVAECTGLKLSDVNKLLKG